MPKRFKIALSFPGEARDFVQKVALSLCQSCGKERVFYDKHFEAELARPNLDTYLQNIYHDDSELIVIFLCKEYEKKEWCGLEWRAIRDLIKKRKTSDIMPIRLDSTHISGLFSIDGYIEINDRSPEEIANLILQRYEINYQKSPTTSQSVVDKTKEPKQKTPTPSLNNQTPPEPNFVGRVEYLNTITDWYKSQEVRIGALIGWGGVGKSALARKWYDSLESNNIRPDGIFWWGFYRNANLELFLNALLRFISGGQIDPNTLTSTWEKADRIKEYINQGRFLIILDGLEQMQKGRISGEQFGCMQHRECSEMLKFLADTKVDGLCLITTRYPLTDINSYERTVYQKKDIVRLSDEDGRRLFKKVGVKGSQEQIDSVITEYDGHALSLTLLSGYLVKDFGGDITKAKDIPAFHSDKEAGGKAHRILLWYAKQLNKEQQAFMKIFSLFRKAITEKDFEGVFRAQMETKINQPLIQMSEFSFKRMVDNLSDRRLISKDQDNTYSTHPLIKSYFDSIFDADDKKLCHKRIYHYFGENAPDEPETLDQMQPLFEQVYHGCASGLYDEVCPKVYRDKIRRGEEHFITHNLGAWETDLSLVRTFFPDGDLSKMPLVNDRNAQSWLLAVAGLALLSTGRPKEAEELLIKKTDMLIEDKDWKNASSGYETLADLQFRTGRLESALTSAKNDLEMAEKAESKQYIIDSKAYIGWVYHLLGKDDQAEKAFSQAEELSIKITGHRDYSITGVFYADFLLSIGKDDDALALSEQNLDFCQRNNFVNDISRCYRNLCAIHRTKGNFDKAADHLQKAFEFARKVGMPYLEIEALLESAELNLATGHPEEAKHDADQVLKICARTGFKFYEQHTNEILSKL
jgi:tetratricopeptide (TPR) repeat protein